MSRQRNRPLPVGGGWTTLVSCALGGASNLIDRVLRDGHVVDYLVLNLGSLHTGVFNLADIAIMAGAAALLVAELRKPRQARG